MTSWKRLLLPALALGIGLLVVTVLGRGLLFLTFLVAAVTLRAYRSSTVLQVDARGVTLSPAGSRLPSVLVPWPSVHDVVVGAGCRVGVRLRPGAPLPRGVPGLVVDPARPQAVQPALVRDVPGLDLLALRAAVTAYGNRVSDGGSS